MHSPCTRMTPERPAQGHDLLVGAGLRFRRMRDCFDLGGEIKNARRTIPRALFDRGSHGDVLLHRRHHQCAGGAAIDGSQQPAGADAGHLEDGRAHRVRLDVIPFAALLIALSNVGAAARTWPRCARLPFVAGIDHFLPPVFGSAASALEDALGRLLTQYLLSGRCSSFSDKPEPALKAHTTCWSAWA